MKLRGMNFQKAKLFGADRKGTESSVATLSKE